MHGDKPQVELASEGHKRAFWDNRNVLFFWLWMVNTCHCQNLVEMKICAIY
jgi:hypothetical protein